MTGQKRHAVLQGTQAAQRLHARLGTRKSVEAGASSRVDVFGAADALACIIHEGPDSTAKGRDRRRNGSRTSLPASGAGV